MIEEIRQTTKAFINRIMSDYRDETDTILTPERTLKYIMFLSGAMSWLLERRGELKVQESKELPELRKEYKTISETRMAWNATPAGIEYIEVDSLFKSCEVIVNACKKRMKFFEDEGNNKY